MAKIKQGILGGFSGKVANVVGTSWKGRAVMKSQPLSVANPKTEAQQEQRGKFSKVAELASAVLTQFVQPVENPISGDISGYNLFCKDNKQAFNASGKLVAAKFVCGGGKIINIEEMTIAGDAGDTKFVASWNNSAGLSALRLTDKVYAAIFDEDGGLVAISSGSATRNAGSVNIPLIDTDKTLQDGETYYGLYAAVSADGRDVSIKTAAQEISVS